MPIQFFKKTFTFAPAKGKTHTQVWDMNFGAAVVVDAWASVSGFNMGFTDGDCHLWRQTVQAVATHSAHATSVTASFGLRDSSGDWDDRYDGDVEIVLFVQLGEDFVAESIRQGQQIALRACNALYVSISTDANSDMKLWPTSNLIGDRELFTVEILDNVDDPNSSRLADLNLIALKAPNGRYVTAEGGGGQFLIANRPAGQIGPWETFSIRTLRDRQVGEGIADGALVALRANNGQFVCADNGGNKACLTANRPRVSTWETFTVMAR